MVRLGHAFVSLVSLLPFAMAQTLQVTLYDDMYYEGDSVQIPANYGCYSLSQFQPDLTDKVSSIQIPDGVRCYLTHWECESIMVDQDTKIVDAPGLSSLYNINFNDQLEKIACYNTNDPQDGF